jgi:hypothetical protein
MEAVIEAGGIPRGGATAADCNFIARGQLAENRFKGQVVRQYGEGNSEVVAPGSTIAIAFASSAATITETNISALCGDGIGVVGHYVKKRTP